MSLAQAEAERAMPDFNARVNALLTKMGLPGESFIMRMTGCPNGCARYVMSMCTKLLGFGCYQNAFALY
jgi:sulfite reductase (ferredoxin)